VAERFVWPPEPGASLAGGAECTDVDTTRAPTRHGAGRKLRWRSVLLDFEKTWLGLTTPPLRDRMADAAWEPDVPHCYCRRCGSTVGPHDADDTGCSVCRGKTMEWDRMLRLGAFSGLLREMVLEVKFTRWRRLGDELGGLLGAALTRAMEDEDVPAGRAVLVPVPMSMRRRLSRGIDHTVVIARGMAATTGMRMVRGLERRHRPPQARLPASERRGNVAGAIRARGGADFGGDLVVVVDDVTTTRATMTAACRAVRKALGEKGQDGGTAVWGAVLGVTPVRGRK
jgi:predicted amidophosphoribosyltransferase